MPENENIIYDTMMIEKKYLNIFYFIKFLLNFFAQKGKRVARFTSLTWLFTCPGQSGKPYC